MSSQGATLQTYNNELVKCLEDLREKRETLNKAILAEEKKKADIQRKLEKLSAQLSRVNESLNAKTQARNEYDTTIQETEAAYMKILESSQTLLHVLKRESVNLVKKKPATAVSQLSSPISPDQTFSTPQSVQATPYGQTQAFSHSARK